MKLVLIVNAGSLLMEGVSGLLESKLNRDYVVASTKVRRPDHLMREIEHLNPTIIVIEDDTPFITPSTLLASLRHMSKIRVIVLSTQVNKACIYDKSEANFYARSELSVADPNRLFDAFSPGEAPLP